MVKNLPANAGDARDIKCVGKIPWSRKWQPTPALLPGKFHGLRRLVGYSPRGHKESDVTEQPHFHIDYFVIGNDPKASSFQLLLMHRSIPAPFQLCAGAY